MLLIFSSADAKQILDGTQNYFTKAKISFMEKSKHLHLHLMTRKKDMSINGNDECTVD